MNAGMYSSARHDWETPQDLFDKLDAEFHFTLDVCATAENAKVERYFTPEQDGLAQEWDYPYRWVRCSLPLIQLRSAHALVQGLTSSECGSRNGIAPEGTPFTNLCEFKGQLGLNNFDAEIWDKESQNSLSIPGGDIPSPSDSLIELSGLLTSNSADTKRIRQELNRRFMYHLDMEAQGVIRGSLLSARGLSDSLVDINTALSINKTSTPSQDLLCSFHDFIIPCIRGFIENVLQDKPAVAFCNPPYGREIGRWVAKAARLEVVVVCLLPARTDTAWWQDYVIPYAAEIRFLRGRLKFVGAKSSAPFPSAIVIFRGG